MPRRIREIKGQLNLQFGEKSTDVTKPQKMLARKSVVLAEKRATKAQALRLAGKAYAIIMRSPRTFSSVNPQHIELYRREFGMDIGALKKGKMSAASANKVIARATAFFQRFQIK